MGFSREILYTLLARNKASDVFDDVNETLGETSKTATKATQSFGNMKFDSAELWQMASSSKASTEALAGLAQNLGIATEAEIAATGKAHALVAAFEQGTISSDELATEFGKLSDGLDDAGAEMEDAEDSGAGLKDVFQKLGPAITAGGVIAAGKAAIELGRLGAQSLRTKTAFANISGGAMSAEANLGAMRDATRGAMSEQAMMENANKLLQMGLAETSDELGRTTQMATMLGAAMGMDAQRAMDDWSAMMANQSLPRLDQFGISSGRVRVLMNELTSSIEGMTREQAFSQAVMLEGAAAMERLGGAVEDEMLAFERAEATIADAKTTLAESFAPAVAFVMDLMATGVHELMNWGTRIKQFWGGIIGGMMSLVGANDAAIELWENWGLLEEQAYDTTGAIDGWAVQMETANELQDEQIRLAEEQAERMLEGADVMEIFTSALEESSITAASATIATDTLAESIGYVTEAQDQARLDAELLAQGYSMGVVTMHEFKAAMEGAAEGTLALSDAERQALQAELGAAQSARDLAEAQQLAAETAAEQAASTMDLATNLKDATSSQIASRLIGMLDPKKMGADAYGAAVGEIGLSFGLMDETSVALATNMDELAAAIEGGVVPTEDADEALQALIEDAADGEVQMANLLDEFGRAPDEILPVGSALRDAGDGMGRINANADGAADGIGTIGAEAYAAAPLVDGFAENLGTTQSALETLVAGSPWELSVVASGGGGGGGGPGPEPLDVLPSPGGDFGTQTINVTIQTGPISSELDVEEIAWRVSEVIGERTRARL